MTTTALLADVQNIYYTTRQAFGRQFDYRALWARVSAAGAIVSATAYAIDRGDAQQRRFQAALREIGFTVRLKPFIQRRDGSAKGDWDVGITIDALEIAPRIERLVLLSGDGDFDLLLDTLRDRHGIRTEVYGVPELTARSLINAAGDFHPIDERLLLAPR
ncbi:MAG: NYN domain-containing protein [Gammaproteobacteria bacterium]